MWKKIAAGIIVLLIIAVAGGYYLLSNLDSFVENAIEQYGSEATGTQVLVGSVTLSLARGAGAIDGLTVANPEGYSTPYALSAGHIAISFDTRSLAGKGPIIVNSVTIEQPQLTYEVKGVSPLSNLQTIQSNVKAFAGSSQAAQTPAQNGTPARKEIIRSLTITGGQMTAFAPAMTNKTLSVQLPPFHVTNLGGPDGATPAQLGSQLLNILLARAASAGATALTHQFGTGTLPAEAGGLLQGLLGN